MKYGYARVSTEDQTLAMQLAALKKAGCKTVFNDEVVIAHLGRAWPAGVVSGRVGANDG